MFGSNTFSDMKGDASEHKQSSFRLENISFQCYNFLIFRESSML